MRYIEEQISSALEAFDQQDLLRALEQSLEDDEKSYSPEDPRPFAEVEDDDDNKMEDDMEEEWKNEDNGRFTHHFHIPSGPRYEARHAQSPMQFFQLFLTPALVQRWKEHTDSYAEESGGENEWSTTVEELYAFIAAHIYMGIVDIPAWHMYWSQHYRQVPLTSLFSRDRFAQLLSYFHVAPQPDANHADDILSRVRPFVTYLNEIFPYYYAPSQHLTIDETMVAFKGRADIKQYIPSKPHKWGYKVYCLASDKYLLKFEIYEGKEQAAGPQGPVFDLVLRLTQSYRYHSHILYTDSWFTSPALLSELARYAIYCCGSVRRNRRGLPDIPDADVRHLGRGEWIRRTKGDTTFVAWKDQKALLLLFNHRSSEQTASLQRWNEGGNRVNVGCPLAIHDYFFKARSVDVIGQLHYSYPLGRKSIKPWSRLVWWLIDICIINAYQLWSVHNPEKSHLQFREQLMHELINQFADNQEALRVSRGPHVSVALAKDHYSIHSNVERGCAVCSSRPENRRQTRYICHACNVHLCLGQCFALYHSRV